ncbi:MAG: hypothetical protein ACRDX9_11240 [Acidimicrobiia bacterium]
MLREANRLILHESRLRVAMSLATPPLLVALAWGAWALEAPTLVVVGLALLAAFLGYVAIFDFPLAVEVDSEGIHRICLVRRQNDPWDDIAGIVQPKQRGLVLVTTDRKRHILLDRSLEEDELDLLRTQVGLRDVQVDF